ncbi:MAG: DoxX family protein [Candidatus Eremiobacteraeota bacterium]|nr:DoxX family protein [Candidatus Eremiobacteraeota bacterium]
MVPAQFRLMEQTLAQSHIPFPHANALFVSLVEFGCGTGLMLGLFTRLCAFVLVIDMIVAIATSRIQSIQAGSALAWIDDFLYLPEVLYAIILIWVVFSGPGRYSVDGFLARRARHLRSACAEGEVGLYFVLRASRFAAAERCLRQVKSPSPFGGASGENNRMRGLCRFTCILRVRIWQSAGEQSVSDDGARVAVSHAPYS